jgi:LysM repeat protein
MKYTVKEGDTLSQIAFTYNISVVDIMRANSMVDPNIFIGQQLALPGVPGPTRLDGERGTVQVTIFVKPDGRQRAQYNFLSEKDQSYYQLTGDNLEPLQKMMDRPIKLWGGISFDKNGQGSVKVEKYEEIFPGLQTQVLTGTQETKDFNGEQLILFTSGGTTYVQMANSGGYLDANYLPEVGEIQIEGLLVPDETYAGYPAIRVFSIGMAINPATGKRFDMPPSSNGLEPIPDPYGNGDQYTPPDITIDKVELVYFVSNPAYHYDTPDIPQKEDYIQPAWHFVGHDANGGLDDYLIQALRQEYLLPDVSPAIPPG